MRPSSSRLLLCAAAVALVGFTGQAGAAAPGPKALVITDPKGDAALGGEVDITQVVVTTSGKVTRVARKQVYQPDTLIFTMTLAKAPTALPIANYEIQAETSRCGSLWLFFDAQDLFSGGQVECGDEPDARGSTTYTFAAGPVVKDNTVVWTIPYADLPKEMKGNATITDFHAYVALGEPAQGTTTQTLLPSQNADNADSDATFKVG